MEIAWFYAVGDIARSTLGVAGHSALDGNFANIFAGMCVGAIDGMLGRTIGSLSDSYIAEIFVESVLSIILSFLFTAPVLGLALELSLAQINTWKHLWQGEELRDISKGNFCKFRISIPNIENSNHEECAKSLTLLEMNLYCVLVLEKMVWRQKMIEAVCFSATREMTGDAIDGVRRGILDGSLNGAIPGMRRGAIGGLLGGRISFASASRIAGIRAGVGTCIRALIGATKCTGTSLARRKVLVLNEGF